MKHIIIVILITGLVVSCSPPQTDHAEVRGSKFQPTWESVKKHQTPEWFLDAKFGIYFHWGPYSVPAYKTEWYSHWMYVKDHPIRKHHEQTYGPVSEFGYKDFIPLFTAEKFDANEWVELFVKSGAQFVGPVTEHADGFAMWDSKLTEWDAMDMGPKRDIVGEMEKAIRKTDLKFITTFHHQWLYSWYPTWDDSTDASDPQYQDLYGPLLKTDQFAMADSIPPFYAGEKFSNRWISRLKEVVNKYNPDLVYFDNKLNVLDEKHLVDFLQFYYNHADSMSQEVVCTYKGEDFETGAGVLDLERARMSEKKPFPWLTDDSIDWDSWCDVKDPNYKSANRIIDFLVDVVSKNGNLLLNITPTAQGEIPQPVKDRLLEIGNWLKTNGEAIYGTRPWKIYGEGPQKIVEGHLSENKNPEAVAEDIRFTIKDNYLYATALAWPGDKMIVKNLSSASSLLGGEIMNIEMLGISEKLKWEVTDQGLEVNMPSEKTGDHAFVLKIEIKK